MFGIIVVVALIGGLTIVGLSMAKRNKTTEDYYLGGRSVGTLVTIGTQCATFVGGGMTLGWIGMGYLYGMSAAWYGAPQALGFIFMALVLVKQMRKYNFTSLPDWFDSIYHNKALSIISALVCLIVPITWVTGQTTAAARMLETIGIPYTVGVIVVGGLVVLFSTIGGYLAVVYTDTIQWILLVIIFICTVPLAIIFAGGFGEVWSSAPEYMRDVSSVHGMPSGTIFLWIISGLVSGMGLQTSYQRIFSAKTEKVAKQGLWATAIATIFFALLTAFVGMSVLHLGAPADLAQDSVWPWFLENFLPSWVAVFYSACVMMATMSTADSMLNSISLTITHDLYSKFINPKADDKKVLKIGFAVSAIFGVIALWWATGGTWMIAIFGYSYTLGAGPLAAAVILAALMKKRANAKCLAVGLIAGPVIGYITLQIPTLAAVPAGGTFFSFSGTLLVGLLGSLILKPKPQLTAGEAVEAAE